MRSDSCRTHMICSQWLYIFSELNVFLKINKFESLSGNDFELCFIIWQGRRKVCIDGPGLNKIQRKFSPYLNNQSSFDCHTINQFV